jgi:hypothetical protein
MIQIIEQFNQNHNHNVLVQGITDLEHSISESGKIQAVNILDEMETYILKRKAKLYFENLEKDFSVIEDEVNVLVSTGGISKDSLEKAINMLNVLVQKLEQSKTKAA